MSRRRLPCDVPGCPCERAARWHRVCPAHFTSVPRTIRDGLANAHKFGDRKARAMWRRAAADHLATRPGSRAPGPAPEATYANTCRLLGERIEDEAA